MLRDSSGNIKETGECGRTSSDGKRNFFYEYVPGRGTNLLSPCSSTLAIDYSLQRQKRYDLLILAVFVKPAYFSRDHSRIGTHYHPTSDCVTVYKHHLKTHLYNLN